MAASRRLFVEVLPVVLQELAIELLGFGGVLEGQQDLVAAVAIDLHVLDVLVLVELLLDVAREAVGLVGDRLVDVDLVDEVQAALEVEAEHDALVDVLFEPRRQLLVVPSPVATVGASRTNATRVRRAYVVVR